MHPQTVGHALPTPPSSCAAASSRQFHLFAYSRLVRRVLGLAAVYLYLVRVSWLRPRPYYLGVDGMRLLIGTWGFPYEYGAPFHEQYVDVLVGLVTTPPIAVALAFATVLTAFLAR